MVLQFYFFLNHVLFEIRRTLGEHTGRTPSKPLFSHKHGKNNNEIGYLFLLCHDLGMKIFKAIQTIKSETKDIIS